jgi:hypothetical protein
MKTFAVFIDLDVGSVGSNSTRIVVKAPAEGDGSVAGTGCTEQDLSPLGVPDP